MGAIQQEVFSRGCWWEKEEFLARPWNQWVADEGGSVKKRCSITQRLHCHKKHFPFKGQLSGCGEAIWQSRLSHDKRIQAKATDGFALCVGDWEINYLSDQTSDRTCETTVGNVSTRRIWWLCGDFFHPWKKVILNNFFSGGKKNLHEAIFFRAEISPMWGLRGPSKSPPILG